MAKEYIIYSYVNYRLDKDLNLTHRFRPNVGIYPLPQAEFSVVRTDFGKEERKFREIINMETGYFIPFSKEKIDEIKSMGTDLSGHVGYNVVTENGLHIGITSYDDRRNGD
jgi:hypothetical protein